MSSTIAFLKGRDGKKKIEQIFNLVVSDSRIEKPKRHPAGSSSSAVIRSAVITTCCVKKKSPTVAEDFPLNLNQNS
jgi:hypothetical protein